MTDYSFTTALDTGMQIQDKAYVVTTYYSKLSVRMPIVLPIQKQNMAIYCSQCKNKNTVDIDLSNISFCVWDSAKCNYLEWR